MDETEKDQYEKINRLTERVGELSTAVESANIYTAQLIDIIKKAMTFMFLIIVFLIATVVYGAIGDKGFNAVARKVTLSNKPPVIFWNDQNRWPMEETNEITA